MAANKTIKFFISSTFKDFEQERDILHKFVFPKLKILCHESGFGFQPIDLRWGVMEEAGVDQQTMNICLNEIKRSSYDPKPNLLLLVGQRYGWVPLSYEIEKSEFDNILTEIQKQTKKYKLNFQNYFYQIATVKEWYIQDPISTINEWYILDENSNPKTYFLQEKSKYKNNRDAWTKIENQIKSAFQKATDLPRYHTSATEQEMAEGLDAFSKDVDHKHTFAYFRTIKDYEQADKKIVTDFIDNDLSKLNELSERLQKKTNIPNENQIVPDDVKWDDISKARETKYINLDLEKCPTYLKDFHDEILERFEKSIQAEIDRVQENSITDLQIELEEQKKFLELKSEIVIGRGVETTRITDFIESEKSESQYYLQYGKSGSGKTSVMAKVIQEIDKSKYEVIYRFIGTTALSTYSRILFESIYWEIETKLQNNKNIKKPIFEYDDQKFKEAFQEQLKKLQDKQVVILLDALDQFEDYNTLTILLEGLPQNIKIVFSTLYDEEKDIEDYYRYYNRVQYLDNKHKHKLEPLNQTDNRTILEALLGAKGRTLTKTQYTDIKELTLGKTPLYLKLVFEMVKHFKVDSEVSTLAKSEEGLIVQFFYFIQTQYHHEESLVNNTLGLISASKDGLSEEELLDLFSRDKEFLQRFQNKRYQQLDRLPTAIWSRFYYYIEEFFTEKLIDGEMLITPFHRIISETIKKEYYATKAEQLHKDLADYFLTLQDTEKVWDKRYNNLHMLSETPYQLFQSNNNEGLKEILFDLEFAGSVYDNHKQDSFRNIMERASELDAITEGEIYVWESFYREKEHLISKVDEKLWRPHQSLFQLLYEDGDDSKLTHKAMEIEYKVNWPWLKSVHSNPNYIRSGLLKVFNKIDDIHFDGKIFACTRNGLEIFDNKTFSLLIDRNKIFQKDISTQMQTIESNNVISEDIKSYIIDEIIKNKDLNPCSSSDDIDFFELDGYDLYIVNKKYLLTILNNEKFITNGHYDEIIFLKQFDQNFILTVSKDGTYTIWDSKLNKIKYVDIGFLDIKKIILIDKLLFILSHQQELKIFDIYGANDVQGTFNSFIPEETLFFENGNILLVNKELGIFSLWSEGHLVLQNQYCQEIEKFYICSDYFFIEGGDNNYMFNSQGIEYSGMFMGGEEVVFAKNDLLLALEECNGQYFHVGKINNITKYCDSESILPFDLDSYKHVHSKEYTGYEYSDLMEYLNENEYIELFQKLARKATTSQNKKDLNEMAGFHENGIYLENIFQNICVAYMTDNAFTYEMKSFDKFIINTSKTSNEFLLELTDYASFIDIYNKYLTSLDDESRNFYLKYIVFLISNNIKLDKNIAVDFCLDYQKYALLEKSYNHLLEEIKHYSLEDFIIWAFINERHELIVKLLNDSIFDIDQIAVFAVFYYHHFDVEYISYEIINKKKLDVDINIAYWLRTSNFLENRLLDYMDYPGIRTSGIGWDYFQEYPENTKNIFDTVLDNQETLIMLLSKDSIYMHESLFSIFLMKAAKRLNLFALEKMIVTSINKNINNAFNIFIENLQLIHAGENNKLGSRLFDDEIQEISVYLHVDVVETFRKFYPEEYHKIEIYIDDSKRMFQEELNNALEDLNNALIDNAKEGNIDKVKKLLRQGADINTDDNSGYTALIWASYMGQTETVKLLLEYDAYINAVNKSGFSALSFAVVFDHEGIAELLKEHGAKE